MRNLESNVERAEAYLEFGVYEERYVGCPEEQAEDDLFKAWRDDEKYGWQLSSLKSSLQRTFDSDALAQRNLETWEEITEEEKGVWVS